MNKIKSFFAIGLIAAFTAGCSTSQLAQLQSRLNNVQSGVIAVNQAIANVSPELLKNCNNLMAITSALVPFAANTKYSPAASAAVAVITTNCQAPPVQNIAGVVTLTYQAYLNAKSAYDAARAGK
jgi:hypothetical protein